MSTNAARTKRPTIHDVARRAGVSKSTVSLVLQHSPQVRDETRKLVEASISELGYVYNRAAAKLGGGAYGLIGLVINDLRNPFFAEFATSAQMAFAEEGFSTVIANTAEDPRLQSQVVHSIIEHGAAAILISPTFDGDSDALQRIARAATPAIQLFRHVEPDTDTFPFFSFQNVAGTAAATRHLIEQGCRRIAFVGGQEVSPVTKERFRGFADVMAEHGLEAISFRGDSSQDFGREVTSALLADPRGVEAAVCFNDLVALGIHSGCARERVEVGRDFRIVGFDDVPECSLAHPQLSSVRCDASAFGRTTAEAVLRWIRDQEKPPSVIRTPVELIARESTLGFEPDA